MNKSFHLDKGSLLVASLNMTDELYKQSVVLVCEYTAYGSFGLILNKPLAIDTKGLHIELEDLTQLKDSLRIGGSMQPSQLMLLHASDKHRDQTLKVTEGVYLGGDFTFLQELLKAEITPDLLLCFGYTGWTAGELEAQCKEELWYPNPASKTLIFHTPPEKLWQESLTLMGGKYKSLSSLPIDLSQN